MKRYLLILLIIPFLFIGAVLGPKHTYNRYEVDSTLTDSGVTTTQGNRSILDLVTLIGTTNNATLVFENTSGVTTPYPITTALDLSSYTNINFEMKNGANFAPSSGVTLTIYSPENIIARDRQQIKTGDGTLLFSSPGVCYPNWWLNNATPGTTDMHTAIEDAISSGAGNVELIEKYAISDQIDAQTSNVTVYYQSKNVNNYIEQLTWGQAGFDVYNCSNITFENVFVKSTDTKTNLTGESDITVHGQTLGAEDYVAGFFFMDVDNVTLKGCRVDGMVQGINHYGDLPNTTTNSGLTVLDFEVNDIDQGILMLRIDGFFIDGVKGDTVENSQSASDPKHLIYTSGSALLSGVSNGVIQNCFVKDCHDGSAYSLGWITNVKASNLSAVGARTLLSIKGAQSCHISDISSFEEDGQDSVASVYFAGSALSGTMKDVTFDGIHVEKSGDYLRIIGGSANPTYLRDVVYRNIYGVYDASAAGDAGYPIAIEGENVTVENVYLESLGTDDVVLINFNDGTSGYPCWVRNISIGPGIKALRTATPNGKIIRSGDQVNLDLQIGPGATGNSYGTASISDSGTTVAVTFTYTEPDTNYVIMATPTELTAGSAAGSSTITKISNEATTGFTINIEAAPGAGKTVTFAWRLVRE